MADVEFTFISVGGEKMTVDKIKSFELCRETDAPCDGLRLWLATDKALPEIHRVKMTVNGELIFNGFCDTQRETVSNDGFEGFIYARSSACVLTGIEAKPDSLYYPSARTIYEKYIKDYGFLYALPEVNYSGQYMINKGTSLFGALDGFVFGVTGKHIYINALDEIELLQSNDTVYLGENIISERKSINRGDLLCGIDYKLSSEESYAHHRESELMKRRKATARVMKNLSALTPLQRENALSSAMAQANDEYVVYDIDVSGLFVARLCDKVRYKGVIFEPSGELRIKGIDYIFDSKGYHTRLKLTEKTDLEELSYVDE